MNTISLGDRAIVKDLIAVNIGSENKHVSNLWVDNIFPTPGLNLTLQDVCDNGNTTSSNITIQPQSFLLVSNIGTSAQHVNTLWVDNIFPAPGLNLTLQDVCNNGNTTTSNITIQPGSYLFVSNIGDANQKVHKITMESEIEYTNDLDFIESVTGHTYLKVKPNRQLAVAGTIKYHEGQIDGTTSLFTAGINTANNYHIRNNFSGDTDCLVANVLTSFIRIGGNDVPTEQLSVTGNVSVSGFITQLPKVDIRSNGTSVAIGNQAGETSQNTNAIAIGFQAGSSSQGNRSIAIGRGAGVSSQGTQSVAIGFQSGQVSQNTNAVAIGLQAGQSSQQTNAVAVGREAGQTSQNTNAIAIGFQAGHAGQLANTIVLNASGVALNGDVATDSFYVSPIRANVSSNVLLYNSVTKEVTYGTTLPSASVPTLQQVTTAGNTTTNTVSFANTGTSLTTSGNVSIGSATSFAGFKLNVEGTTGTGIRLSDTTNDASLRTTFANGTATIEAAKSGAVSTAIDFKTQTSAGSTANTMTLNGGNVGIGTTTPPTSRLQVLDDRTTAGQAGIQVQRTGTIIGSSYGVLSQVTGAATINYAGFFTASGGTNNYGLIVSAGRVGIGITSPTYLLDVAGTGGFAGLVEIINYTTGHSLFVGGAPTNSASNGIVLLQSGRVPQSGSDTTGLNGLLFQHTISAATTVNGGYIYNGREKVFSSSSEVDTYLSFATTVANTNNERMRISSAGVVTINAIGTGTVSATAGVLSAVSDSRLKDEDGFITDALPKVLALKPRYYKWKTDNSVGLPDNVRQLGFFAQEVQSALGEEVVNTPPEGGYYGIHDRGIIAMLVKAVQEQQAIITELKIALVSKGYL